ncbi:MAG: polysaccharide deacetylase family protein [Schwartzia sp.]|nr:polysaccharide deacetylase family protein [Schwartzia sp. (in: firmicutes)]
MKRLIAAGLAAFTLTFSSWAMQPASFAQAQSAYSTERQANAGRKAERQRFVYTTEQAVVFTFGGLSKRGALEYVLDKMDEESMRGTFFVTERELERNRDNIDMIVSRGHELAIGIRVSQDADKPDDFDSICGQIERVRSILSEDYGTDTNLVREMTGSNEDFMFEAVSAMGCRLMGQSVNVVRTKDKNAKSAEEVMETLFGKGVRSLGRGQIVYIRTDFYEKETLAGDMMLAVKHQKIDNIAYRSLDDTPERNPQNDSAYRAASLQEVLNNSGKLYDYPVAPDKLPYELKPETIAMPVSRENLKTEFYKRYIGSPSVDGGDRMLGFSSAEIAKADKTGVIKNVPEGTVFLTFDDWGNDDSINKLLYVLRKHHVPATFFIITWNMPNNPNLLRAIAQDGHDIASHTDGHKAMARYNEKTRRTEAMQDKETYAKDVAESYEKLAMTVGDVVVDGRHPLTRLMRPPTLALNKNGVQSIFDAGFTYIVSGFASTTDYKSPILSAMVGAIQSGIYDGKNRVRSGSVIVMHMTASAKYTARALDLLLTENEKRADGDPLKFRPALLSTYLVPGYDQRAAAKDRLNQSQKVPLPISDTKH